MSAQSVHVLYVIKKPCQTENIPLIKAPIATVCHAQCFCVWLNDLALIVENADMGFVGDFGISGIQMYLAAADQCGVTLLKGILSKSRTLLT